MTLDLDTFLTALYTTVDDLYSEHYAHRKPQRPGRRPELSDSEVLTLAVCAQWFGTSERAFIRHASEHWRSYFPRLLNQSSYNRRIRDMTGVLADLVGVVASEMRAYAAPYQAIDTVPVPLMRRCRGKRQRLFGDEAAVGRGGSDRDWYYGCKLMVSVTPEGISTGFPARPGQYGRPLGGRIVLHLARQSDEHSVRSPGVAKHQPSEREAIRRAYGSYTSQGRSRFRSVKCPT